VRVLHGSNLNLLGRREPEVYGTQTLADLNAALRSTAAELGVDVEIHQSNHEGQLVTWIQDCELSHGYAGVILNPGGYTHASVAIQDAIRAVRVPVIEVHLSNIFGREALRHTSITGVACAGVIMGLGFDSYLLALKHFAAALPRSA
jgi:3-dehydroquinate dehydratase-2